MIGYLLPNKGGLNPTFRLDSTMESNISLVLRRTPLTLNQIMSEIRTFNATSDAIKLSEDQRVISRTLNHLVSANRVRTTRVSAETGGAIVVKLLEQVEDLLESYNCHLIVLPNGGLAIAELGEKGDTFSIKNVQSREVTCVLPRQFVEERLIKE